MFQYNVKKKTTIPTIMTLLVGMVTKLTKFQNNYKVSIIKKIRDINRK